jgi:hypothetical protein
MSTAASPAALLEAYQTQLRAHVHEPMPESVHVEWDGPLQRASGFGGQGWILYRDLGGIEGDELDELIARQVRFFAELGQRFEWKYHSHDLPDDLPERLLAAGFVPEERETVVIADRRPHRRAALARRVAIREAFDRDDMERIAVMERTVTDAARTTAGWTSSSRSGPQIGRAADVRRRGRRPRRLGRLGVSSAGVRDLLGRRDAPGLARPGIYRALVAHPRASPPSAAAATRGGRRRNPIPSGSASPVTTTRRTSGRRADEARVARIIERVARFRRLWRTYGDIIGARRASSGTCSRPRRRRCPGTGRPCGRLFDAGEETAAAPARRGIPMRGSRRPGRRAVPEEF